MRTWHTQSWIGGCGLILATLTLGLKTAIATDISGDKDGISGQEVELLSASNDLEDTTLPTDYVLISECAGGGFSHPACRTDDGTGVEIGDKCGDLNDSCAAIDDLMCVGGKEVSREDKKH